MKKITLILLLLCTSFAFSQNVWEGNVTGATGYFSVLGNWDLSGGPLLWTGANDLVFVDNGSGHTAMDVDISNPQVANITYNASFPLISATPFPLSSSTSQVILFKGKIENDSPQAQLLDLDLVYTGTTTPIKIRVNNGDLYFSKTIFNTLNKNYDVYGNNHKKLVIVGDFQGGGKLNIKGASIVEVNNGFGSFGGGINVQKGQLWLGGVAIVASTAIIKVGNTTASGSATPIPKKVYISHIGGGTTIPNEILIPNHADNVYIGARNQVGIHEYAGEIKIKNNNSKPVFFDTVDPGSQLTLSGKISSFPGGSGIFEKIGPGRITINNDTNTFSGLTKITDGVLILGDGGAFGKINGDIENNATLFFNRSGNQTFSNNITGTGDIDKKGSGKLVLSGAVSCTGSTTVTNSLLLIDSSGSFSGGQFTVKTGAEFRVKSNNVTIDNLVVEGTGKVIVFAGATLTVTNGIVNDGDIIIKPKGSLVQISDTAVNTGTGTYQANVAVNTIPASTSFLNSRYTYFSSPVAGQKLNVFSAWANMNGLYSFNAGTQNWQAETNTTTMTEGVGYIVRTKELTSLYPFDATKVLATTTTPEITAGAKGLTYFAGSDFNNGISTHTLAFNMGGTDDDNTLLGNPYPSGIDTQVIFDNNPSVNSLHFWRHATEADASGNFNEPYAVRTRSGSSSTVTLSAPQYIATGQGFFVEANATGTGTLTFNNAMRVPGKNNEFLRSSSPQSLLDKAWFNITTSTGIEAQVLIAFIPTCSDGFDNQYDAHNINSGTYLQMYTNGIGNDAQNLVIQAKAPLNNTDTVIPLGFDMDNASITNLTISLSNYENFNGYDIYLRDIQQNILHDIKQGDYNFTVNQTGNFNTRFEILFNRNVASVNDNLISENSLMISNQENDIIKINMIDKSSINKFEAYDILGKLVISKTPKTNSFEIETAIKNGTVLFIKATLDNGQVISKKFIKL